MDLELARSYSNEDFARRAVAAMTRMIEAAKKRGLEIPPIRESSVQKFMQIPEAAQERFVTQLERYLPAYETELTFADEFLEVSVEDEIRCLDAVCGDYGIRYPRDMDNTIQQGDIIEIYDTDGVQIYRNLNFFKTSNYNLLDVMSHTWMDLWDRPAMVQEALGKFAERVMMTDEGLKASPCQVPNHILKERAFGFSQALLIRFQNGARVEHLDGSPFGVLLTLRTEILAEGPEADKIGFV